MGDSKELRGIFPILATCFSEDETIDYDSQESLIEYCIRSGVHGLVTLANASEGHLLSDDEKKTLSAFVTQKVAGRVPVVVTVNHAAARCAAEMAHEAERQGADAVMCMPPFFGRWRPGLAEIVSYFETIDKAVTIPMILQDHHLSDISLPVDFLISLSNKLTHLHYLKLEFGNIIHKTRKLLSHPENRLRGVFGGNSGVFLPEEYAAGCCGTMPACYMPEVFRKTWDALEAQNTQEALQYFTPFSRLAAYEKDVANRCLWKEILVAKNIIRSSTVRGPQPAFFDKWHKEQLMQLAIHAGIEGIADKQRKALEE
jgi:4-hydroxy-tetrahydrodipicolinate synthase